MTENTRFNALLEKEKELYNFSKFASKRLKQSFATARLLSYLKRGHPHSYSFYIIILLFSILYCFVIKVTFIYKSVYIPDYPSLYVYATLAGIPCLFLLLICTLSFINRKLFFWNWSFKFMRYEGNSDSENYPALFLVTDPDDSDSGFIYNSWLPQKLEVGDVIIGGYHNKVGYLLIFLKKAGRLGLYSSYNKYFYKDTALPRASKKILELAYNFISYCNEYKKIESALVREKKLSSGTPEQIAALMEMIAQEKPQEPVKISKEEFNSYFADIFLVEQLKERIINAIYQFVSNDPAATHGILLYGPPGTGKTLIAEKIATAIGAKFVSVSLSDIKKGHLGESGIATSKILDDAIAMNSKVIIFIDECDSIFLKRNSLSNDKIIEEIITVFLQKWDGINKTSANNILIIGATNRMDILDEPIKDRFETKFEIGLPDGSAREKILENELKKLGRICTSTKDFAKILQGFSGRDIRTLAKEIGRSVEKDIPIDNNVLIKIVHQQRAQESGLKDNNASWETLILPEHTLKKLRETAFLLSNREDPNMKDLSIARGIILYGPSGTGKTQIASVLSS